MKTLLVGSGHLAQHLQFYFKQKNIPFSTWKRSQDLSLFQKLASESSHILLAISDSALKPFIQKNLLQAQQKIVHFSGALNIEGVFCAHPLMSFGLETYSLQDYEKIHFVLTSQTSLSELIPGIHNHYSVISAKDKALYHALCVMGGNFPILLWQKMSEGFKNLGLPPEASQIYLEKIVENFNRQGQGALTGPLVRKDHGTIEANLAALSGDPFQKIYSAFVEAYQ